MRLYLLVGMLTFLQGCASLPNATINYYLPKSKVGFKVVRTVTCDKDGFVFAVNSTTPEQVHFADPSKPVSMDLKLLKSVLADADVKFDFYADGRLKGLNATSTGRGEEIVKAMSTLIGPLLALDGGSKTFPVECELIKKFGDGKPLTLSYQGAIDPFERSGRQKIQPEAASATYVSQLHKAIGDVIAVVNGTIVPVVPVSATLEAADASLIAQQPGAVLATVYTAHDTDKLSRANMIWEGSLTVAQLGVRYALPLPKKAAFGKQTFVSSFSEAGTLENIQYASEPGVSSAFNAANFLAALVQPKSTTEQADKLNAEANLIMAQQRLAQCLAAPKECK